MSQAIAIVQRPSARPAALMPRLQTALAEPNNHRAFYDYARARAESHDPSEERRSDVAPKVLTVPEACAALKISKWMLYQLVRSRQLETIKIGRRRVVPVSAIEDLIARLRAEGEV